LHLLGFATLFLVLVVLAIGTLGILCCLIPLAFVPLFLGLYEVRYGLRLLANPAGVYEANRTLAIVQICLIVFGNVVAFTAGVLSLIAYSDERATRYFAALRGEQPAPPPPPSS